MAPTKPMGTKPDARVGFPQKYNQEPPPTQDLNPDAVTEDSVLPTPANTSRPAKVRKPRATKKK